MLTGLDYAGGIPRATAIKAAGHGFVCRYLTSGGPGLPGKLIKRAEYEALVAAGVSCVMNWETTADRMLGGFNAGVEDARNAEAVVRGLGLDSSAPAIYFSADWDSAPGQQGVIDDYLRGVASVIGPERVGVYGSFYVVDRCLKNGTARWFWQAGAWSGGQVHPQAHIYQRIQTVTVDGVDCDVNEARVADYGQHPYTGITKRRRTDMSYRIEPTPVPANVGADALPDASWPAVEHTIGTPGPSGGWSGKIFEHLTLGWLGGFIQEAWSGPSGKHFIDRYDPIKKTGGRYVKPFDTQSYEIPAGDRFLVLRLAVRNFGDVIAETEK